MITVETDNGVKFDYTHMEFSGGEVHVNMPVIPEYNSDVIITASLTSSYEVMLLAAIKDVISSVRSSKHRGNVILRMFYCPYARQDRRCAYGDAFTLKIFCGMINAMEFDQVVIADPHSDVTAALLNNVRVISQCDIIECSDVLRTLVQTTTAISPDAGSNKKTHNITSMFGRSFVRADKIRNPMTGQITDTVVYKDDFNGEPVTIWDDICDGGRTFIELARVLKSKNAGDVNLYVTHGIFSKGLDPLINGGITHVYATDSLLVKDNVYRDELTVIPISKSIW